MTVSHFRSSLIFACNDGVQCTRVGSGLARKYQTRMEVTDTDKRSSLLIKNLMLPMTNTLAYYSKVDNNQKLLLQLQNQLRP